MGKRILVIDDSETIQKVIRITFEGQPVEVVECKTMATLEENFEQGAFALILLDYTFSDKLTGAALAKKITTYYPTTPIIAMLGAFDTVSSDELELSGVVDKITKPFESSKFLQKCLLYVDTEDQEIPLQEMKKPELHDTEVDEFSMRPVASTHEEDVSYFSPHKEWDFEVPAIIGTKAQDILVPPFIDGKEGKVSNSIVPTVEETVFEEVAVAPTSTFESGVKLPKEDDLEYPDLMTLTPEETSGEVTHSSDEWETLMSPLEDAAPKSKLVSLDELAVSENDENDDIGDYTQPHITLPVNMDHVLEKEIESHIAPEEFWAVDEEVVVDAAAEFIMPKEEIKSSPSLSLSVTEEQGIVRSPAPLQNFDQDEMMEKIKETLMPQLELMVQNYIKEYAKEITWQVVSNVVENLVAKEIEEIKQSVADL